MAASVVRAWSRGTPRGIGPRPHLPEGSGTLSRRFNRGRAYQGPGRCALCCWAVIPETAALEVARQMDEGDHHAALLTLDRAATTLGPILPSNADGRARFGGRDCR